MAITSTEVVLATAIVDAILSDTSCCANPTISNTERQCLIDKWTVISREIINHFVNNTDVLPGTFIDSIDTHPITGIGGLQ